jgi:hypothetical protein
VKRQEMLRILRGLDLVQLSLEPERILTYAEIG